MNQGRWTCAVLLLVVTIATYAVAGAPAAATNKRAYIEDAYKLLDKGDFAGLIKKFGAYPNMTFTWTRPVLGFPDQTWQGVEGLQLHFARMLAMRAELVGPIKTTILVAGEDAVLSELQERRRCTTTGREATLRVLHHYQFVGENLVAIQATLLSERDWAYIHTSDAEDAFNQYVNEARSGKGRLTYTNGALCQMLTFDSPTVDPPFPCETSPKFTFDGKWEIISSEVIEETGTTRLGVKFNLDSMEVEASPEMPTLNLKHVEIYGIYDMMLDNVEPNTTAVAAPEAAEAAATGEASSTETAVATPKQVYKVSNSVLYVVNHAPIKAKKVKQNKEDKEGKDGDKEYKKEKKDKKDKKDKY